jgi:hypothetical protein
MTGTGEDRIKALRVSLVSLRLAVLSSMIFSSFPEYEV